jgi:hypothetical protein
MYDKEYRKKYGPTLPGNSLKLLAILKHILITKYFTKKAMKQSVYLDSAWQAELPVHTPEKKLNYLAIVYDGVVEEMIRVDDVTAKFLLGGAELVLYDPKTTAVKKSMTYINKKFVENPEENKNAKSSKES